ncbi:hypothetical protein OS493_019904 [Desmophyllum pertusum]|uniref:Uncharacterized protein n=1 Tax=Desmophyllum pertusum TaxID=174260 RepID=A0A9W9YMZ1_9CNID|nr:hypothetical protein OS493_019904 [Desmophyllum pertusum]
MGDLTTYDTVKHLLLGHTSLEDKLGHPHYIKWLCRTDCCNHQHSSRRCQNKNHEQPNLYKGSIDCFLSAVREEGFISLYKGWLPTWSRMAPWSLTFWLVYERIRNVAGVAGF